jgi:hypothetical protein
LFDDCAMVFSAGGDLLAPLPPRGRGSFFVGR